MHFLDREEVRRLLTYERCIDVVRTAMMDFSSDRTRHLLRSILPLAAAPLVHQLHSEEA